MEAQKLQLFKVFIFSHSRGTLCCWNIIVQIFLEITITQNISFIFMLNFPLLWCVNLLVPFEYHYLMYLDETL